MEVKRKHGMLVEWTDSANFKHFGYVYDSEQEKSFAQKGKYVITECDSNYCIILDKPKVLKYSHLVKLIGYID